MVGTVEGGLASRRAAAAQQYLDGFQPGIIEVMTKRKRTILTPDTVRHRWRRLQPSDITTVDGIPCTNIATTLCQLGAVVPRDRVELTEGSQPHKIGHVSVRRMAFACARSRSSLDRHLIDRSAA